MNADIRPGGKELETKRLCLRAFKPGDLEDLYGYASECGVPEMAGRRHYESINEAKAELDSIISEDRTFAICLKDGNKVIGHITVEKYGMEEKLSEFFDYRGCALEYLLGKAYWGKGIMPEALKAVISYLFNEKSLDFLLCGYFDSNMRSKRVQEKTGFLPYRKLTFSTKIGTKEEGVLNLLLNPGKKIVLDFSHKETLIYPLTKN